MKKYELSISADYVPKWGTTEAVREFFQNAKDEETADESNKMFFAYDVFQETLRIGNKHSILDIKTLLFGQTTKKDNKYMIGSHGEGYKIATTVLMRAGKTVVFYNYCNKEIWRPRLVKSRRYGGVLVPTFFVEDIPFWDKQPEHSLVIEIQGINPEEYDEIVEKNLSLQNDIGETKESSYGRILLNEKYKGRIFVSGLYICTESRLDNGFDFNPAFVKIDRDRDLVSGWDVQYYAARMWEETKDKEMINKAVNSYSGSYIHSYNVPKEIRDEITEEFINEHGALAVPVVDQEEATKVKKCGYKPIITTEAKKEIIMSSSLFSEIKPINNEPPYDRLCSFIEKIEDKLTDDEVTEAYGIINDIHDQLG